MENWSYRIRELWTLHQREIKRYGLCAIGFVSSVTHPWWPGAAFCVLAAGAMYAYDRWGEPWAERGRKAIKGSGPKNKA
jgi:hypothetical protein